LGSYWLNGGQLAATLNYYSPVGLWDEERDYRYLTSQSFIYQLRTTTTCRLQNQFFSGWTYCSFIDPDGTIGLAPLTGQEQQELLSNWEPWLWGESGWSRPNFIRGVCAYANGVGVPQATVESYISANGALDGSSTTDSMGNYAVPCYYSGNHYVTAYLSGSPDVAGITVNTLVPGI
jgi:hypothetical protein